jgi:hypothetical protein
MNKVDVIILLPVSVEKNPLFTFAYDVFRILVVSVLPVAIENPIVDAVRVEVWIVEPAIVE